MIIRNKKIRDIEKEGCRTLEQVASLGRKKTSGYEKENLQTKLAAVREHLDIEPKCVEGRQYYSKPEIIRILDYLKTYRREDEFRVSEESIEKMRAYIERNGNTA